jgi:hypothetical protein
LSVELVWRGGRTFAALYRGMSFYFEPSIEVDDADLLIASGVEALDETLPATLARRSKAKLVIPKSVAEPARAMGIDYSRMTTTDAALRVEYFKNGEYGRVYGVPAARPSAEGPQLDYHPIGGYPRIGFMARFGATTIWHSGCGVPYPELADRLRPYSLNAAIVSIGEGGFSEGEAAELAERLQVPWLIPAPATGAFVDHMLFHRPSQRFKTFELGERWEIPGS